jgi:predicted methyltransferase
MSRPKLIGSAHAAAFVALFCATCVGINAQRQDDAADAARLVEVLGVHKSSVVADIGAGSGELTVRMALIVDTDGRVYSTDINPERLKEIREAVEKAGLQNVTVVEGGSARTNLPGECCDAIFMRHVYHHLGDPQAMNASLLRSLKPGGRVAVVDFAPDTGRSAPPGRRDSGKAHGVMPATVIEELSEAGFDNVRALAWPSSSYFLVVGEKPRPGAELGPNAGAETIALRNSAIAVVCAGKTWPSSSSSPIMSTAQTRYCCAQSATSRNQTPELVPEPWKSTTGGA